MIGVISRWKLRDGCPPELEAALEALRDAVQRDEPGTLMYSVGFPAPHPPIGPGPDYGVAGETKTYPAAEQTEVVIMEVYRDAEAFSAHLRGAHADFMAKNRHFFATPWQGHPRPDVSYIDPRFLFARAEIGA